MYGIIKRPNKGIKKKKEYQGIWVPKTWSGYDDALNALNGQNIWTDGIDIYLSNGYGSEQYKLIRQSNYWDKMVWNNQESEIYGQDIWTDGTNIYNSKTNTYILDVSTHTWSQKYWSNWSTISLNGRYMWNDGTNFYYSQCLNNSNYSHKVLDRTTNPETWNNITWKDKSSNDVWYLNGRHIWHDYDGNTFMTGNIMSYGNVKKVLLKGDTTWDNATITGAPNYFEGYNVWTDGTYIYQSDGSSHYVLDRTSGNWISKTWQGLTSFSGEYIWHDGDHIYYTVGSTSYELT